MKTEKSRYSGVYLMTLLFVRLDQGRLEGCTYIVEVATEPPKP